MSKLSYEGKINIYNERKQGNSVINISKRYDVRKDVIKYLIRLIDKHGYNILLQERTVSYPAQFKQEVIDRILINHESIREVAIDLGLPSHGIVNRWLKIYKENGYNIVEPKRRSTMNNKKKKNEETKDEKIKRLEIENTYLKAELEYVGKLRAVVQARKNQQQKKK